MNFFVFKTKLSFEIKDIREVLRLDPKNKEAQQAAARLMITVEKENEASIEKPISPKGLFSLFFSSFQFLLFFSKQIPMKKNIFPCF